MFELEDLEALGLDLGFDPDVIRREIEPLYSLTWYEVRDNELVEVDRSFRTKEDMEEFEKNLGRLPGFAGVLFRLELS